MAKAKFNDEEEQFPSNSKSGRTVPVRETRTPRRDMDVDIVEEPRRTTKPVAQAIRRKKTLTQSIAESFVGGDESKNVGLYILNEVLIPAAKSLIQEMVTSGMEMFLFGETSGRSKSRSRDSNRTTISYGSYYKNRDRDEDERRRPGLRDKFGLGEIYFRHGDEAADVLEKMCELLEKYKQVSVADYFELADIDGSTWAHNKYGWDDLRRAKCTHTRNGYVIVLPEPIELD